MTDDVRGAILARCAELRRIAEAAATREGGAGWLAAYRPGQAAYGWDVVISPDQFGSGIVDGRTEETAAHVATWDPAAVLALVDGAEEMCEVHKGDSNLLHLVSGPNALGCKGCGYAEGAEWLRNTIGECPSLALAAKMIGAKLA